ncbi:hypothetical protein ACLOJK_003958, partial [Asimina triloba]
ATGADVADQLLPCSHRRKLAFFSGLLSDGGILKGRRYCRKLLATEFGVRNLPVQ